MPGHKVGCLCVCEPRIPLLPIALESFAAQTYKNRTMLIKPYVARDAVLEALDAGCAQLFDGEGCDYVAMWDDDDYHPPRQLELAVKRLRNTTMAAVAGYTAGWYVNIKTMMSEFLDCEPLGHLWGASLVFNAPAWESLGDPAGEEPGCFRRQQFPGYDKALQSAATRFHIVAHKTQLPVAFVHGKNVATHMGTPGKLRRIAGFFPDRVERAVYAAHRFFNDNDIHVPSPEV